MSDGDENIANFQRNNLLNYGYAFIAEAHNRSSSNTNSSNNVNVNVKQMESHFMLI